MTTSALPHTDRRTVGGSYDITYSYTYDANGKGQGTVLLSQSPTSNGTTEPSLCPVILIIISLCAIILGVSITAIISFKHLNADVYMFKSIEECWKIETQAEENGVFNRYLDTSRDNYLSGLSYNSFFSGKYSCEQYEFEIFAYEFNDTMSAIEYFKKITGKNSIQKSTNFSLSSGIAQSRIIAISETNAYVVYCPTKDFTDVCKMLEKTFTVKIS